MSEKDEILKKLLANKKPNVDDRFVLETIKRKKEPLQVIDESVVLTEISPPAAATVPDQEQLVLQVSNVLKTANSNTNIYRDREIEGMRRTIAEMMQKISTLSWGGGGTGIVRLFDADDFDRATVGEGKFMKFSNGWFVLDDINPGEIVNNTTVVTTNTYTVVNTDYYIGVNYAGPVTITIPASISSGREVVIKDESGNCETNNITVNAKVDNDANGFILAINNGAVHMLYRGDSWRII
jgi:hypothetical protein